VAVDLQPPTLPYSAPPPPLTPAPTLQGWNVIVGRQFGAYVTHEIRTYAYFTVCPDMSILVWRLAT